MNAVKRAFATRFASAVERKTPGAVRQAARFLLRLEQSGYSYSGCLQLLEDTAKLEREGALLWPSGDDSRRHRAYVEEAFHLIRGELQILKGRIRKGEKRFAHGSRQSGAEAWIDGSFRNDRASAGFTLYLGNHQLACCALPVLAKTSTQAEVMALVLALKTAHAFGLTDLLVMTDAECLVDLMTNQCRIANESLGLEAVSLALGFKGFELCVIPRLYNHHADSLALALTRR